MCRISLAWKSSTHAAPCQLRNRQRASRYWVAVGPSLGCCAAGVRGRARTLLGIAARTSDRFDQTFALIQRTQMLEKTLRTQLSPQMSAALRFSRTLNQQVQ